MLDDIFLIWLAYKVWRNALLTELMANVEKKSKNKYDSFLNRKIKSSLGASFQHLPVIICFEFKAIENTDIKYQQHSNFSFAIEESFFII